MTGSCVFCCSSYISLNPTSHLKIQLIESVNVPDKQNLWQLGKYWQAQVFILSHGLNS